MDVNLTPVNETWSAPEQQPAGGYRWYHKLSALLYILFCFEVGTFLLLFPWLELWDRNFFAGLGPGWRHVWDSPYVRGAVSGLGLVNILMSFVELFRLHRFSHRVPGGKHPIE